jgi:hypothetical protein
MLAVLAPSLLHSSKKMLKAYEAAQAHLIAASMTQIERYFTLIIEPEMKAFSKLFQKFRF